MHTILIEAEGFEKKGGWVIDQQFMDQMGSPYLLAHGIGRPVADAVTNVTFPAPGKYHVWVRTMDWVARWNAPGTPGRFQIMINQKPLVTTFGTEGADWHWQDGGIVDVGKQATIALHDLTGFEGRCDAILFCSDASFVPPNGGQELATLREKLMGKLAVPENVGKFDLVVAGGGIAGICTAISAARHGLTVALVHDRPVLGGNNSPEVRVWLGGEIHQQPYPQIGNLVQELEPKAKEHYGPGNTAELYEPEKRLALLKSEPGLSLFLNQRVIRTEIEKNRIGAIIAQDISSGRRTRLQADLFTDCTGDGNVGFLAGADFEMTEKDHMGPSNLWNVKDTGKPVSFPRCPWAFDLTDKPFPGRGNEVGQYAEDVLNSLGVWFWENGFSHNSITDAEMIRDTNFRAMYGAWDVLKNVDKMYPNHALNWSAYISGPRESRRLMGDVVLTRDDVMTGRVYEDACFPCTWTVDLHYPDSKYSAGFEGTEFISIAIHDRFAKPYWAPYRCLYSRNISNLFMAGRDISVTHEALGTVRVMRTTGMMGEVIGMAAAICQKNKCVPREVHAKYLNELKNHIKRGVPSGKKDDLIKTSNAPKKKDDLGYQYRLPSFKEGTRLLFQGDSITDMNWGRNEEDRNHYLGHSYVFLIAARLGVEMPEAKLDFYNRGMSGHTVANLRERWQKDALDMKPDLLSILVGRNDVGQRVSPEAYERDYRFILDASQTANPDIRIVLIDPFLLPAGTFVDPKLWATERAATDELCLIVKKLAWDYGAVHVKMQDVFDAAAKTASPEHWIWDGAHPLPQGHELIARQWLKEVSARWPQN